MERPPQPAAGWAKRSEDAGGAVSFCCTARGGEIPLAILPGCNTRDQPTFPRYPGLGVRCYITDPWDSHQAADS